MLHISSIHLTSYPLPARSRRQQYLVVAEGLLLLISITGIDIQAHIPALPVGHG